MKLIPVLTEKSLSAAGEGKYTFWVLSGFNKNQIREAIEKTFKVHVVSIKTLTYKGGEKKNFRGQKVRTVTRKKAIVTLGEKEKIDLFDERSK